MLWSVHKVEHQNLPATPLSLLQFNAAVGPISRDDLFASAVHKCCVLLHCKYCEVPVCMNACLKKFWLIFPMWARILEPFLVALSTSVAYRSPTGAEWILFGLVCYVSGIITGAFLTALICSQRLRHLLGVLLLEGSRSTEWPVREDRLAGYRRQA